MKAAKISYLNNKWTDIYDFTPDRVTKKLNYSIDYEVKNGYVTKLSQMKGIVADFEKRKGFKLQSLKGTKFNQILL
jgi:hypothetical protein